ncbi:MAG: PQQ-binding-like beta-propeller repeat protein [Gammaproteobacteria bacterium]
MRCCTTSALAAGALLAALASPSFAQVTRDTQHVAPPTVGWPTNGGDWYNRRYSPLTQIDRTNVAKLKGVWRARLGGSGVGPQYSGEAQPLVIDGVVYVSTGANDVFAINVDTGATLWDYHAHLDPDNKSVCCSWTNRGVAAGGGKIFIGQLDGKLVALDARSGKTVWSTLAEKPQEGFTITAAPLYYNGLVIVGFAGAELGVRGRVKAFDAKSGKLAWTFYTIPGRGEPGNETWPQDNEIWAHGGATVWQTPAVDPELGLIFFSTGNPGPDFNGGIRKGDNLYTSSIMALDAKTGKYRWHYQQVHHDLWDYDSASPVILFDITLDGKPRKAVAEASKSGWVYILDRTDGKPLVGIDERAVPQEPRQATAATQPYPRGDAFVPQQIDIAPEGYTLVNGGKIFTPYWTEYLVAKPGISGGANWPPSALDPVSGHMFVCARDNPSAFRAWDIADTEPPPAELYIGGNFGSQPLPPQGTVTALDMHTNKIVWQQHWASPCNSGATATAGGLMFVGRSDGRLTALDSSNGNKLWEFQTGAGMNSTVSVFGHNGKQYVVAYSAGAVFSGSVKGDSVWLFALDGTLDPVPAGK